MSNHINTESLPFVVCAVCAGFGTTGPGWVMTQDDVDEMGHEFDEYMDNMRSGYYDVPCDACKGQRVVKGECPCVDCEQEREDDYNDRAAAAFEARYC